jgi:hypothetical protein
MAARLRFGYNPAMLYSLDARAMVRVMTMALAVLFVALLTAAHLGVMS